MIVGQHGPAVVISAETAYYLERLCNVAALRQRLRDGRRQQVSQELLDLRQVAMSFDPAAVASVAQLDGPSPQPAPGSEQVMFTVAEVADQLNLTPAAVTKACREKRVEAELVGDKGRWLITAEALNDWKTRRTA